jgi:DNA-binding IclR family transcriptional regulator
MPRQRKKNDGIDDRETVEEGAGRYQVRALERGLAILSAFDGVFPSLTPAELSRKTGLPKPTVFRLLQVLSEAGFVEKSPEDEACYRVGARALGLGGAYLSALRIPVLAQPLLDRLQTQTGETAMFSALRRDQVLLLAVSLCRRDIALNAMVGTRYDPHCTALGKVLLGGLAKNTLGQLIERIEVPALTPRTITSKVALSKEIERAVARGWALEDEEREPGVIAIAAPVYGENYVMAGAFGIAAPKFRVPTDAIVVLAQHVTAAAADLTRQLRGSASQAKESPNAPDAARRDLAQGSFSDDANWAAKRPKDLS